MNPGNLRVKFIALWSVVQILKIVLAATLPLFVDEAFYRWEGQQLAWAYSDLPGLTAWLTRLGIELGGDHRLALRAPFLLLGALVPWQVLRLSSRWFGEAAGPWAGLLCLLMPLSGLLGVLAVPDVPLVVASLLCLDAIARLRERVEGAALGWLALALVVGALSHYRFAMVIFAGLVGLLCDSRGRQLLRDGRLWLVLALGAAAWIPLLAWNLGNGGAGLQFQLLDRNPWSFHADGALWLPVQLLLVTPPLFILLLLTLRQAWRLRSSSAGSPWALLAGTASVSVLGYLVLGFFADSQRVSFHWPLAGWLVLLVAAPVLMMRFGRFAQTAILACAGLGLLAGLAFLFTASQASSRSALADSRLYPADFAGWDELGTKMQAATSTRGIVVASNFGLGAELSHSLGRSDVFVLDSALNHKHGRAKQLQLWGLQFDSLAQAEGKPVLLIVDDAATPLKHRLAAYHDLCAVFGALPAAEILSVDHGRKRYLVYRVAAGPRPSGCTAPALAWVDSPGPRQSVPSRFNVAGWAFKDGVGLKAVEVTLDSITVATAAYGRPMPNVAEYWKISTDPKQPNVGFSTLVDATTVGPGKHWLGLRLHGLDGSVEAWPEQSIVVEPK